MIKSNDLKDFGIDVLKNSGKAVAKTFDDQNRNSTMSIINGGVSCALCLNMIRYNAVPLATLATCVGCSFFVAAPTYKAVKEVIKAPFKGFNEDF